MAKAHVNAFQKHLGIVLPDPVVAFLAKPKELEYFSVPSLREVADLSLLSPRMPSRVLPLLESPDGDTVGLYIPRLSGEPFVVYHLLGENRIIPLTGNIKDFMADPDKYSPCFEDNNDKLIQNLPYSWQPLLYNFSTSNSDPELELLKPLSLNSSYDGENDIKRIKKFNQILIKSARKKSPQAQIISEFYTTASQIMERQWWIELAEKFIQASFYIRPLS